MFVVNCLKVNVRTRCYLLSVTATAASSTVSAAAAAPAGRVTPAGMSQRTKWLFTYLGLVALVWLRLLRLLPCVAHTPRCRPIHFLLSNFPNFPRQHQKALLPRQLAAAHPRADCTKPQAFLRRNQLMYNEQKNEMEIKRNLGNDSHSQTQIQQRRRRRRRLLIICR